MTVTFCHTNQHYDSYVDFWRLVTLSGYPIISIDDMQPDDPDQTYIVTPLNGNIRAGWPGAKAHIVVWVLEWFDTIEVPPGATAWVSDLHYARRTGTRFVPLGSHPDLISQPRSPHARGWDIVLMMYTGPHRRRALIGELERRGVTIAPNGWGDTRNLSLKHARLMVHIHQHERFPYVPAQRFAMAASARLPLLSEECPEFAPFTDHDLYHAPYSRLADAVLDTLAAPDLEARAASLHERACVEYVFRTNVERALETRAP